MRSTPVCVCLLGLLAFAKSALYAADCDDMKLLKLPDTAITTAERVSPGDLSGPGIDKPLHELPAFCRVTGVLQPTADSEIRFEVWLPEQDWNQRFLGIGNGGFAGTIGYEQLAGNLRRGFSTAGSDAGHQAKGEDATWAFGHPEKIKDFGWRAVHLTAERAKDVVKAYYGKPADKAYFDSCSDGGREALMEALRFPQDYDGILAGAPANAWSHMLTAGVSVTQETVGNPAGYISSLKLPAIERATLAACDAADGVKDGFLSDPAKCRFDPAVLFCKGADSLDCLTRPQVESLKRIYAGGEDGHGHSIFPGLVMGDERAWDHWVLGDGPSSSSGAQYPINYFRYMVTGDPKWNILTADVAASLQAAVQRTATDLDSTSPDLTRLRARGGKLIIYHGWNDPAISPWNSIAYYQSVQKEMGGSEASGFLRLYMVPGMEHCVGGPGPAAFGQFGIPTTQGPRYGMFDALVDWVEKGVPADTVIATKYAPDNKAAMTRPLCPYPAVAKYKGAGDTNDAANFTCKNHENRMKPNIAFSSFLVAASLLSSQARTQTATPVKHIVVIFDENVSFDHYFGTYPNALNPPHEPAFKAKPGTSRVNGLTAALLERNPNFLNTKVNQINSVNPFRLGPAQAATADQSHDYTDEQHAFHAGLMDSFPRYTGVPAPATQKFPPQSMVGAPPEYVHQTKGLVMSYFDGNTVTALWNYAQRYALNDNSYGSTFGQSTQGAIELISGQTNGVTDQINAAADLVDGGNGTYTEVDDADPIGDKCSSTTWGQLHYTGNNIGQMLSKHGVSWGWFESGFDLTKTNPNGTTGCRRSTYSKITLISPTDYIPHHEPFQYYTPTANLLHTRPSSVHLIGKQGDGANHQYDSDDFFAAVKAGNFPAVSFLKAPAYQDAHAGYSDPLDEQTWMVTVINFLERQPEWKNTAIIVAYDDSDGWYDHQMGPIMNQSISAADGLTGPGQCGDGATALPGPAVDHAQGRCGYGPRLPLLVISPFARRNYVDHSLTDQTSVLRFIEDNWLDGERVGAGSFDAIAGSLNAMFDFSHPDARPYILDESTGKVLKQ